MKAIYDPAAKLEKYTFFTLLLGYAVVGLFAHSFLSFILIKAMILSIFSLGYSLLFSRVGLLSFGHAAFYAVGAYAAGLVMIHMGNSMVLSFFISMLAAVVISAVIGFFSLLRTKIYFAMLTLAFGMGVYTIIWEWTSLTGGDDGLIGINRNVIHLPLFNDISLVPIKHYYFFVLLCLLISILIMYYLVNSPFGLILKGIKQNETRMRYGGFSPKIFAFAVFIISGLFAGLSGYLDVFLENNASPAMAHWSESALPIFAVLLGGMESVAGPLVGATILTLIVTFLQTVSQDWKLWYGLIFVFVILGFRGGIMGFIKNKAGLDNE